MAAIIGSGIVFLHIFLVYLLLDAIHRFYTYLAFSNYQRDQFYQMQ
jgi:hypothetical protein